MFFVYEVRGPSGFYIGKTKDVRKRWGTHLKHARRVKVTKLYAAIRKYGTEAFSITPIATTRTDADAAFCEIQIIAAYKAEGLRLYNLTAGGDGVSGWVKTAEWRAKVSASNKGRKKSAETRALLSAVLTGRKLSPEHKQSLSKVRKGRKFSEAHKKAMSLAQLAKGYKHTEEAKRKIAEGNRKSLKGRKLSEEHKKNISAGLLRLGAEERLRATTGN